MNSPRSFDLGSVRLEPGVTLLEASAGTGKTFTIAGLFLRLLLEERLTVGQILVVTFTEAATAELRGRIRERLAAGRNLLRGLADSGSPDRELLLAGSEERRGERLAMLEAALEQFDDAAVFTLHGFCRRVLQERAFESRTLFDVELEPDSTRLWREAADQFWRRHFYEAGLRQVLLVRHCGVTAESLYDLLRAHLAQAEVEILGRATQRDWRGVMQEADAAFDAVVAAWTSGRTAVEACFGDAGGAWAKVPYNRSERVGPMLAQVAALMEGREVSPDALETLMQFRQSVLNTAINLNQRKKGAVVPEHPFFEACDFLAEALEVLGARLRCEFLVQAPAELARLKERDRQMGFDDLLAGVAGALAGPAGPSLARLLRQRHRAALIDEFQDTDPLQWRIFSQVFGTGECHLYLVGDPKQAIYSFRGADVFAYLRAREAADRELTLDVNWRSERGLVEAVNGLFQNHPSPFATPDIQFRPVGAGGRSDAAPFTDAGFRPPPLHVWHWDAEAEGVDTKAEQHKRIAEAVADEIVRLLGGGCRIGERPLQPGDIAVLVDRHSEAAAMAAVLSRRGVPSVQQTQESVFATPEAQAVQSLMEALTEGGRDGSRRALLASSLVGLTAKDLDRLRSEEAAWDRWLESLHRWAAIWVRDGFLLLFETVLRECGTRERLLRAPEGERRLTNLLHLAELLQQEAVRERLTPRALLHWLSAQRARSGEWGTAPQEALLRLERDAAAVQLVTFHRSKGLEYPVVFCPFLTRKAERGHTLDEPVLFHDPEDGHRLKHDVGSEQRDLNGRRMIGERFAENLRLLYVALTRARNRCYLVWGSLEGAEGAALSWLLHPPPEAGTLGLETLTETLKQWVTDLDATQRRSALEALAGDRMAVVPLASVRGDPWTPPEAAAAPEKSREFRGRIRRDWGLASFSTLAHGRTEDAPDRDAAAHAPSPPPPERPVVETGLTAFRGARAGTCLHEVFERIDFSTVDRARVQAVADERLRAHGFGEPGLATEVSALVERVLEVELIPGATLRAIPERVCWRELEFLLPLQPLTPARLREAFAEVPRGAEFADLAESLGRLGFAEIGGFLGGFMDLVFVHEDRWWLVDWKSNWLGDSPDDYPAEALWREMLSQQYPLQYHLYLLALHRLLRARLPGYDYDRHIGGVRYVFVRGVTPGRPELGLFRDRPPREVIEALERRLLVPPGVEEAS
jgi:exodeoxyribonuclease V beta subunit